MAIRIVADVLIPGRGDPVDGGTVVMEHGAIAYAGATKTAPAAGSDDDVVEAPVVMPGLWDCHTHFVGMSLSSLDALATIDIVGAAARAVEDAGKVLDGGITSVRELCATRSATRGRAGRSAPWLQEELAKLDKKEEPKE